jgi:quercetin dioxygenase-like cupin family protein
MKVDKLKNFTKGWVVGNFEPSLLKTDDFEVAVKYYKAGDYEEKHYHKVATEITIISEGSVRMNGELHSKGSVITIEPGEATDFKVVHDTITTVIKFPCVEGDKYLV